MVTDMEMSVLTELNTLCEDFLSKKIVDVVQEMLGALDADGFKSAAESTEFISEYADEINDIVKDAVFNNKLPKRKVGDYEVLHSFEYGGKVVFLGENPSNETERYVVGFSSFDGFIERYFDCLVGDNYNEIAEIYSQRIQEQINKVKVNIDKIPFDRTVIGKDSCDSISNVNLSGKVIVINPDNIKREYVGAERQLYIAKSGNGCSPESLGQKVFCTNLYTGKDTTWYRQDVLGTIKPECMPEWAKERLAEIDKPKSVDDLISKATETCENMNNSVASKNDIDFGKE